MKKLLLLALCLAGGCAQVNKAACWVDQQWEPCEQVAAEDGK